MGLCLRLTTLACAFSFFFGCKPKSDDSDLQSIVSQDEKQAFGLAGIRKMGMESEGMYLGLISCESTKEQKAAVWLLQAINMGVFGETYLEKTGDIRFRNEFGNYHRIPCKVVRTASGKPTQLYDMRTIRKAFQLVGQMPKDASEGEKKKYITAQTLFLSMRGPSFVGSNGIDYSEKKGGDITFATYHEVARSKGTLSNSEVLMLANRIKERDPIYNPCDRRSGSSAFPDVPSYIDDFKQEFYSCHKVNGNVHVYKLKSDSYSQKLNSVVQVLEAAHAAALGGPRANLTAAAEESAGFSLQGEAAPAESSMDVFAPVPSDMQIKTPTETQKFDQMTGNQGTQQIYAENPANYSTNGQNVNTSDYRENRYVIGTQGTGNQETRQPTSLFTVGQGEEAGYQPFTTTGQSNDTGTLVTQSQNEKLGATTYDSVLDGERHVQTWLPAQQPGIEGFKQAFPEATDVSVSRLQGTQNGSQIEQYSWMENGERKYALGLGGLPDANKETDGSQGLFIPMERMEGTENAIAVTATGRDTAQRYVESLTSEEQRASAQAVFDEGAERTVLNSNIKEGPVGMGYFSTIMDDQQSPEENKINEAVEANAFAQRQNPASVGSVNPVTDEDGKPVFAASRIIENRNVDTGGGGQMDKLEVRANANLDPTQTQTLVNQAQSQHLLTLEERVEAARNQYKADRQIYGNPNDPNSTSQLERSRSNVTAAESALYNYQMRNRPDYLEGRVSQLNRSIEAAGDDPTQVAALTRLRDREQAALQYAQNYRQKPQRMDLQVNPNGTLAGYTFGAGQTTTPAVQAAVLRDYNREVQAARRFHSDDGLALRKRLEQINRSYEGQGLSFNNGLIDPYAD